MAALPDFEEHFRATTAPIYFEAASKSMGRRGLSIESCTFECKPAADGRRTVVLVTARHPETGEVVHDWAAFGDRT